MQLLVARGHEGLRSLDGERVLLDLVGSVVQGVLQGERSPHDAVGGHSRRRVEAAQTHLQDNVTSFGLVLPVGVYYSVWILGLV